MSAKQHRTAFEWLKRLARTWHLPSATTTYNIGTTQRGILEWSQIGTLRQKIAQTYIPSVCYFFWKIFLKSSKLCLRKDNHSSVNWIAPLLYRYIRFLIARSLTAELRILNLVLSHRISTPSKLQTLSPKRARQVVVRPYSVPRSGVSE